MERKLATVVFVDLVDSTGLVASADPEVVRRRVTRFFERVSQRIQVHGGKVEKFAGDAVMAAFGIPQAHEDDAERAIRASLAILDSVRELGLEARVGIESGEVVADSSDSTFATGEAVNVAARLQQQAQAGQILLGPGTHRLTLGRIQAEDLGPIQLRGLEQPIWTWAAVGVNGRAGAGRAAEAPFVGREPEGDLLENTFARAIRDRRAHLFTVFGEPGVGKTRLSQEFLSGLEGATVLAGRALPYGESITYWPLAEMVKASADIADDDPLDVAIDKLRACCPAEAVADLLGLATGVLEAVHGERSQQEIAWAAREWAEVMAGVQPLVLVFEDIHWAEEPLLDLIEHLASWVREAPVLILCLSRPELLDLRPEWGGGRVRATAIELEALGAAESEELADALLRAAQGPIDEGARRILLEKTEGNPLFLEETVRMLSESGGGSAEQIPDTVQALIAARIDRLGPQERTVLQRASVIGRSFWGGAIGHLAPDVEDVECVLDDLLLRDFVAPESRSTISGERAYRFKHVLIREVAYAGLAKSSRADHHLRFADWLSERAGDELLEIRAFHLDQATALLAELDGAPPAELANRAAEVLEHAGRRALSREAYRAARHLLLRSSELGATLDRRWLAARAAARMGDWLAVPSEMEAVRAAAHEAGERKIEGRALTALAEVALYRHADVPKAQRLIDRSIDVLADVSHPDARFEAFAARSLIAAWVGDLDASERFLDKALKVAQEAGRKDLEANAVETLAGTYLKRMDVDEAGPLIKRALELADESGSVYGRTHALQALGDYRMVLDEFEEARAAYGEALELAREMGNDSRAAWLLKNLGRIAQRQGDFDEAERRFREATRILKPLGERGHLCEVQRMLAQVLVARGRLEEAERVALEARETVGEEDAVSQLTTAMALGVVRAAQGRDVEAETLLRNATEGLRQTQFRSSEPEALRYMIEFLCGRDRHEDAAPYEARLVELCAAEPAESAARIA
jgi:class 3 adenylate cyclase/tetratricopeptide (TPR) repeat protein